MFRKFIITVFCCMSISLFCVVSSYADSFGGGSHGGSFGTGGFSGSQVDTCVSFDVLSSLAVQANADLAAGKYGSALKSISNQIRLVDGYYLVQIYYNGQYYSLRNNAGGIYYARYNDVTFLQNLTAVVSTVNSNVSTLGDKLTTLINKATSIQSSLTDVVNYLSASTQSLARLSNTFNSDFFAYFLDIWNDISDISSKLDTIAANVYTSSGGSSSVLPDEYRRLSYIETNGQQYINTSIYFDSSKSFQIDADVEFTNSDAAQILFGFDDSSNDVLYSFFVNPHLPAKTYCFRYGSTVVESSSAFPTSSRHSVISYAAAGQQYFSIDGVTTLSSSVSSSFTGSIPCYLFALNSSSNGFIVPCYVRCYGVVIRQNGSIVRNYIPALRYSDNVPGLYDLVSGEFFPSAGKRFIAGPVMSSWTYDFLSRISSTLYSIETKLSSVSSSSYSSCWCTEDSVSSLNVSDVGYSSLSSLLSFVLSNGTDLQVYDGVNGYFNLEDLYSVEIVQATVGGRTGYYLRAFGQFYRSVDAVNQYCTSYLYLGMPGGGGGSELFYASSDSLGDGSDLTGVIARLDTIIEELGTSSGSDLTTLESTAASIESTLSIINDKLDSTATKIENTTVNITNDNSAYNVFYVTDEDGNEHSITSVAGDSLSAGGKLLNFLYKLVVDGALSGVDGAVDGLGDFFFDSNPSGLGEGVSVWD